MNWRAVSAWAMVGCAGSALGLGAAWAEAAFVIPKFFVSVFFLILFLIAAGFAVWVAWSYYRAIREENEWD